MTKRFQTHKNTRAAKQETQQRRRLVQMKRPQMDTMTRAASLQSVAAQVNARYIP